MEESAPGTKLAVFDTLRRAFRALTADAGRLAALWLLPHVPLLLLAALFGGAPRSTELPNQAGPTPEIPIEPHVAIGSTLLGLLLLLAYMALYLVTMRVLFVGPGIESLGASARAVLRRVPALVGLGLLWLTSVFLLFLCTTALLKSPLLIQAVLVLLLVGGGTVGALYSILLFSACLLGGSGPVASFDVAVRLLQGNLMRAIAVLLLAALMGVVMAGVSLLFIFAGAIGAIAVLLLQFGFTLFSLSLYVALYRGLAAIHRQSPHEGGAQPLPA